jgi:hypothetical protein
LKNCGIYFGCHLVPGHKFILDAEGETSQHNKSRAQKKPRFKGMKSGQEKPRQ